MNSPEKTWRYASIAAVIVMIGLVAFDRLAPEPNKAESAKQHRFEIAKLEKENELMLNQISAARKKVQESLWKADLDTVSAKAMATVDQVSTANQVKVQAFRPQRTVSSQGIDRYPYSAVLQGPFPKVLLTVRQLQNNGTKLAVTSVQISAADGETDTVTATIGLAAFAPASTSNQNG